MSTSPKTTTSLHEFLTGSASKDAEHNAAELTQRLIKAVGYDACRATRNTTYIYSVISDYRDVYHNINKWITDVNAKDSDPTEQWNLFTSYTDAVDITEENLLKLFDLLGQDSDKQDAHNQAQDLNIAFRLVELYDEIRTALSAASAAVRKPELKIEPSSEERFALWDDNAAVLNIRAKFSSAPPVAITSRRFKDVMTNLTETETGLAKWSSATTDLKDKVKISTIAVQFWMLVDFVFEKAKGAPKGSSLWKLFQHPDLWNEIKKTAAAVNDHLKTAAYKDELKKALDAFITFLKSQLPDEGLPDIYFKLVKAAAQTGRPFFGRAVVLVKECRVLTRDWKDKTLDERTIIIENVFNTAKVALDAAIAHRDADRSANFLKVSPDVDTKFEEAQTKAESCFNELQASRMKTDWDSLKGDRDAAEKRDREHKKLFEERASKPDPVKGEEISVTIEVKGQAATTTLVQVDKNTRLSGLLWQFCKPSDKRPSLVKVKNTTDDKKLAFDKTVGEVAGASGKELSLEVALA
ncbi:hypothetical protein V5O48_009778 [Marasmius crinis-equi]|uniref:UBX domain-containing protein n=1 Tax=Marasmius crinis-equi TaxID=585013 RepID=A0ABR3FAW6_9AGAR